MSFKEDLRVGEAIERVWLDKLLVTFKDAYQTFGNDSRFDIYVPEIDTSIEVKYDPKSLETGNIVIEYYHNKPSGMLTTEADYWLFVTPKEEIWISRKNMFRCVLVEGLKPTMIHGPEDRHPKAVFLVPVKTLRLYAQSLS